MPAGYDFCDILPNFIDYQPYEYKKKIKYDFGLGDIQNVPGLKRIQERAIHNLIEKVSNLTMILPGTQGYQFLCEFLAEIVEKETNLSTKKENIIITDGGCDGIALAAMAICDPGDGITYAVPAFPFWSVLYSTGVKQYPIDCWPPETYRESFGFLIEETIKKNENIKAILVNEPENPIGFKISENQLKLIAELVDKRNIFVILDDVARPFVPEGEKWWGRYFPPEKCFVIDSFTKRFALPGLRLGFVRAEKKGVIALRALVANMRGGVGNFHSYFGSQFIDELRSSRKLDIVSNEVMRRMNDLSDTIKEYKIEGINFSVSNRGIYALFEIKSSAIINKWKPKEIQNYLLENGVKCFAGNFMFPNLHANDPKNWIFRLSVGAERNVSDGIKHLFSILTEINQ